MGFPFFEVLAVVAVLPQGRVSIVLLCNCKGRAVRGLTSKEQKRFHLSFVYFQEVLFELAIIFLFSALLSQLH